MPDDALKYAKLVRDYEKSSQEDKYKTGLYSGIAYLQKGDTTSAVKEFTYTVTNTKTKAAAEAKYNIANIEYLKGHYKASQKTCFDLAKEMPNYDYWVAKTYILLADNYVKLKDSFQAKATLQQAQAALSAARLNLERPTVHAPVDGYVTNLNVHRGHYAIAGAAKLAIVDSHSFWVYGYFEETKLPHVRIGDKAHMRLMSGGTLEGHVESISRGIYDRDNPQSRELLADVNPTFNWVRLAQRLPVRIPINQVPPGVLLSAGTTCTVIVSPAG